MGAHMDTTWQIQLNHPSLVTMWAVAVNTVATSCVYVCILTCMFAAVESLGRNFQGLLILLLFPFLSSGYRIRLPLSVCLEWLGLFMLIYVH